MNENTLRYKGYAAKITFSDADGCLIGKIATRKWLNNWVKRSIN